MKKIIVIAVLFLALWVQPAQAVQLSPDWLTDTTGQITPETKAQVNQISQDYQRETSRGLYSLVISGAENGLDAHRYIREVFYENLLTEKDILVLLDILNRKVEIFSGQESGVTDAMVQTAIADAKPSLAESNWNQGLLKLVCGITFTSKIYNLLTTLMVLFVILIVVIGVFCGEDSPSRKRYYSDSSWDSSSGSSSGGGSGGDSF